MATTQDPQKTAYLQDIRGYYIAEYDKMTFANISQSNANVKTYLQTFGSDFWSTRNRIVANTQFLKYLYAVNKPNVITVCFKVTKNGTSAIYANLHISYNEKGEITPRLLCTGPTFRSQDGEYRGRVLRWEQFMMLFEYKPEIFEVVEKLIVSKFSAGNLTFHADIFAAVNTTTVEKFIIDSRLAIKLYMLCWIFDFHNIHNKLMENHINPAYQYIVYQAEDAPIYDEIVAEFGTDTFEDLQYRIMRNLGDVRVPIVYSNMARLAVGQKIHVIGALEAVRTNDINFDAWREIYIAGLASNLVLNIISPCFPFINNWFYIQSAHGGLFDNAAMHEKYEHSKVAEEVTRQLHAIDKYNYADKNRKNPPINNKFARLSRAIHRSIIYGESDLKLTDLAICVTSEHVGRTLRDIPMMISGGIFYPGMEDLFTDVGIFAKLMFEFVYSFYCMNKDIGIIHGDLHMNNATVYQLYNYFKTGTREFAIPDPHIAYIVDTNTYIFPHRGCFANIIDFSRAIIGDKSRLKHEFSARFADLYFIDQQNRVMQLLHHYFPQLIDKYRVEIAGLIERQFPNMFKIITAIDTYSIMTNIQAMLTIDKVTDVAAKNTELLTTLIKLSGDLIVNGIKSLLEHDNRDASDMEWPNLTIIRAAFGNFCDVVPENTTLVEIFNSNNKIIYDINDFNSWGPLLSIDKEIELRQKHGLDLDPHTAGWVEYKEFDESLAIEKILSKYKADEHDVLQFDEWMFI